MKKLFLLLSVAFCLTACSTDKEYQIETSDGVILYVHVKGRGEPCLYLHGGPGSGSTWMKEMGGKELEKRFTMVYLDQRGACRSSKPVDDNFSLCRQTLDFEEIREALGFDQWYLLGHSFGGILEIAYWRDYPESIRGMIFEDCTLSMRDSFIDSWLPAAIEIVGDDADPVAIDTTADVMMRMSAIQGQLDNDTRALIFTKKENKYVSDTLNSWSFHKDCICHEEGEHVMGIEEYWSDFRPLTSTVTVPVLFFVGKYDRAVGPDSWKDLQFPDAIIKIGDCGHFPFLESPEEWAAALDEYQNRVRGCIGRPEPCGLGSLKSRYADMDGVAIHYKEYGEGPRTIAFVHGFGCDINCWEQQFIKFKEDKSLRLVFVDLPGYGKSGKPEGVDYTLQYFADAVSTVLDSLHTSPAVFVGHSLGTPVCRQMMMSSAYGLSMLDIDGVYCFYGDEPDPAYQEQIDAFASSFDGEDCKDVIAGFAQSLAGPETPQSILEYSLSTMPATPQYVASSTMHNLVDKKWWNGRIVFPQPVSVICTQNSGLDPDNKEKMEALYSDLEYTELETCGHFIQMEQPDLVNDAISKLIERTMQCSLEDFDFAVSQIENNYAGFDFKISGKESEWKRIKKNLRMVVENGSEYPSSVISDLCAWFQDFHLYSSFRYDSQRYPRDRKLYMYLMDWYSPEPTSARVDEKTWLIRVPTWDGDENYVSWVSKAIEEYEDSGCENLIIDERSNSGGSDWQYSALLDLLYLQDGRTDGIMMKNTKDNRDRTREIVEGDEFWTGLMDKCEQCADSAYVQLFGSSKHEGTVDTRRPKKTAVIIDNQVASSAEQFLLDVRAVAPDVVFIGQDNTLGCIDVSNIRPARLPHYPNSLYIPTTISYRASEGRAIDGKGIAPDIIVDLPLPDTLSNNVDSWTRWAAGWLK